MKAKTVFTFFALLGVFLISSGIELRAQEVIVEPEPEFNLRSGYGYARPTYIDLLGDTGGERNSKLVLSKEYTGQSVNKEGNFSVEKSISKLRLSIHGKVHSGSITVALVLPDGTEFKKLTMDETADITWSESINIKKGENKYFGDWKYRISTNKADGHYNLSINTY